MDFFAVDEAGANIVRRFLARAYVFDRVKHWDGCELEHPECALLKLEQLRAENDKLRTIIGNVRQTITEVQLIDNTPREAAYVRLELLYSL